VNLNARAAARLLGVPEPKVHEWAAAGTLPSHRVHEQLRFNRVDLIEWASARKMKVRLDPFDDDEREERPAGGPAFRPARALERSGVRRGIEAGDARAALAAVARLVPLPPAVDREAVAALFAARAGLTPVGGGIAIPHARSPAVLPLDEPAVVLGFLARPIDAGAADRRPVGALFAVFSRTVREHLDILAAIAAALSDDRFHEAVARAAPDAEVLGRLRAIEGTEGRP